MTQIRDLHTKWMEDPAYRVAYNAMEKEFALASALIEAKRVPSNESPRRRGHGSRSALSLTPPDRPSK